MEDTRQQKAAEEKLQDEAGYRFRSASLLRQALTHTSYANEKYGGKDSKDSHLASNQRLEFLGDSVLGLVVSAYLYKKFPQMAEGELSKLRAAIVCEGALFEFGKKIGLNECLMLGVGEQHSGGSEKPSIVSDAFESLIAAIYLDGGMEEAERFILSHFEDDMLRIAGSYKTVDHKTNLQELMGKRGITPEYEILGHEGPEHDRWYVARLTCGKDITFGKGRSKKEAEQLAAGEMLARLVK